MTGETVRVDLHPEEGTATITLNRPQWLNAVNLQMGRDLERALGALTENPAVGAVVLTGAGAAFSAGGDLKDLGVRMDDPVAMQEFMQVVHRVINAMAELEKPIIAAVHGDAAGAGWSLALAADLIVASTEAKFIQAFVRVGAVPDLGSAYFLPRLIGPHRAKEWIMLGDVVSAAEAYRLGVVNRLAPPAEVLLLARQLAGRLSAGPRKAIGMIKQMVNRYNHLDLRAALEHEAYAQAVAFQTGDFREGVQAFRERRAPTFGGRRLPEKGARA